MSTHLDEQGEIDRADAAGDFLREMGLRSARVARLLPSGLFLARGTGRTLVEDLSRLRQFSLRMRDQERYAHDTMHLSYVVFRLDRGDIAKNQDRALKLIQEVLEIYSEDETPREWAQANTFAATFYNERENGDETENLRIAERHCRAALRVRSPTNDPIDWAYTASNLAENLNRSSAYLTASDALVRLDESVQLSKEAAGYFIQNGDTEIGAQTWVNAGLALMHYVAIGRRRRRSEYIQAHELDAFVLGESITTTASDGRDFDPIELTLSFARLADVNPRAFGEASTPEWADRINATARLTDDERSILDEACSYASAAHSLEGAGVARSRASQLLGDVTAMYENSTQRAASFFQRAYDELGDAYAPRDAANIAELAGQGWSMLGEWEKAAEAYINAISAIDEVYRTKSEEFERELELVRFPKIAEMTAYALAKTGQLKAAVLVLERARARNLTRRLLHSEPDIPMMETVDPELTELIGLEVEAARLGDREAFAKLTRYLSQIGRANGSDDGLGIRASAEDIGAASTTACPLVYLVATPAGSLSLLVEPDRDELHIRVLADSKVTSASLVTNLATYSVEDHRTAGVQARDTASLERGLQRFADDIGSFCGRPVVQYLHTIGSDSVVFVAAGILSSAPLSAARVGEGDDGERLIDSAAVTLAPSAGALIALRRRRQRQPSIEMFVGLADAEREIAGRHLRWSEPEVRRAANQYSDHAIAAGSDATTSYLRTHARDADVLHVACHGVAAEGNPWLSSILLADRAVPAHEIWDDLRLESGPTVVLSTCESAQYGIAWSESNEYVGLAGAFLAAGAASVVCSLAEVNDYATSILMSQFHVYLRECEASQDAPARALRRAQQWFRRASISDLADLVREEGARGQAEDDTTRSLLSLIKGKRHHTHDKDRPLSHWAQFIVVG